MHGVCEFGNYTVMTTTTIPYNLLTSALYHESEIIYITFCMTLDIELLYNSKNIYLHMQPLQ